MKQNMCGSTTRHVDTGSEGKGERESEKKEEKKLKLLLLRYLGEARRHHKTQQWHEFMLRPFVTA